MSAAFFNRSNSPEFPIEELLRQRGAHDCFSSTAVAISTEPGQKELLSLLLRCRTMDEVKRLGLTRRLRAENKEGCVELSRLDGRIVARAWLFD